MSLNSVFVYFIDFLLGGYKKTNYFRQIFISINIKLKKQYFKQKSNYINNTFFIKTPTITIFNNDKNIKNAF